MTDFSFFDPDRFDIDKFTDAMTGQFTPVARMFNTTKWQSWVGGDHAVDENHPGFDLIEKPVTFLPIIGPGTTTQAKR